MLSLQPPCGNNRQAQNDSGQSARLGRCIPSTLQPLTSSSSKYFSGLGERPWLHQLTEWGCVPICQRRMHLGKKWNGRERREKSRHAIMRWHFQEHWFLLRSHEVAWSKCFWYCGAPKLSRTLHWAQNKGTGEMQCSSVWTLLATIFPFSLLGVHMWERPCPSGSCTSRQRHQLWRAVSTTLHTQEAHDRLQSEHHCPAATTYV